MPIYDYEETKRLICQACFSKTFYEREVSGYTYAGPNGSLEKVPDKIQVRCANCDTLACDSKHKIKKKGEN